MNAFLSDKSNIWVISGLAVVHCFSLENCLHFPGSLFTEKFKVVFWTFLILYYFRLCFTIINLWRMVIPCFVPFILLSSQSCCHQTTCSLFCRCWFSNQVDFKAFALVFEICFMRVPLRVISLRCELWVSSQSLSCVGWECPKYTELQDEPTPPMRIRVFLVLFFSLRSTISPTPSLWCSFSLS